MDQRRSSSELTGSEARHNTPIPGPPYLDLTDKNGEDIERVDWTPSRNIELTNEMEVTKSYREQSNDFKTSSHISKLNSPSNLPRLVPESNSQSSRVQSRNSKKRLISPHFNPRYQPKDIPVRDCPVDEQKNSSRTSEIIKDLRMGNKKSAISLPKIDTYCISNARPTTNHGFSYMVCATDLIKAKNCTARRRLREKSVSQTYSNNSSENDFYPNSSNLYLLFQAPSGVCGPNLHPFTVRTKPKGTYQSKRGKTLKKPKKVKNNTLRLPDINEEVWK